MHVLILPSWYPRYDGDAEGSFFRDQACGLAEAGLKVGVLFPDLRGPKRYFRSGRLSGLSIRHDGPVFEVRVHGFNWFPRFMPGFEWLWCGYVDRAFANYVAHAGMPDIIHAHSMEPAASAAARLRARFGIPFVITEHSSYHIKPPGGTGRLTKYRALASASNANIAVSEIFAEKLESMYGGGWLYLPNIVSRRFLDCELSHRDGGVVRIVSAGGLSAHKRMDLVLDAVALLRARHFPVELVVVGDGKERSRLERQATALGIANNVQFRGRVAASDMPAAMASGHILVSASEFETFGVTLIEGLALGMPVVATRSGGPESIVTPQVGALVDRGDAGALAEAIETIASAMDRYPPATLREHCAQNYSTQVISEKLKSIYTNVVGSA